MQKHLSQNKMQSWHIVVLSLLVCSGVIEQDTEPHNTFSGLVSDLTEDLPSFSVNPIT